MAGNKRIGFTAVLLIGLALATPGAAQTVDAVNGQMDNLFGQHETLAQAFKDIQAAVETDDAEALAALVAYPITVKVAGEERSIEDAEAFAEAYAEIMTPEVKQAVLDQRYADLFVNSDGVMFGTGQVWFSDICLDEACGETETKIIAINN